jgi:hypothetical protein
VIPKSYCSTIWNIFELTILNSGDGKKPGLLYALFFLTVKTAIIIIIIIIIISSI